MRIGVDAMGSDQAPAAEVKGALAARSVLSPGDKVVLIGRQDEVRKHLDASGGQWQDFIEVVNANDVIRMGDPPVESLRSRPNSSIAMMAQLHAEGKVDAIISAGNTGACVAAATMRLRRLRGVHRPGIAVITPTMYGPVVLCNVGANVSCRPQHLYQFGIMAAVYAKAICNVANPRVALLSVGEEEAKGNDLVKRTHELFKNDVRINFVGNAEGRDIFRGGCDVVACDGFVGNVVLKLMEGMAEAVIKAIVAEATAVAPTAVEGVKLSVKSLLHKWDFNEYGGAPLLGVDGICIICHGASDPRGIKNAVRVARASASCQVNEHITEMLSLSEGAAK